MARSGATPVGTSILVDPARGRAGRPDPAALGHESVGWRAIARTATPQAPRAPVSRPDCGTASYAPHGVAMR